MYIDRNKNFAFERRNSNKYGLKQIIGLDEISFRNDLYFFNKFELLDFTMIWGCKKCWNVILVDR